MMCLLYAMSNQLHTFYHHVTDQQQFELVLAILEAATTTLLPGISKRLPCIFSVPNQPCCVHDSPAKEPSVISASQADRNSRTPKGPSYQTPVQFRRESSHHHHAQPLKWECVRIFPGSDSFLLRRERNAAAQPCPRSRSVAYSGHLLLKFSKNKTKKRP